MGVVLVANWPSVKCYLAIRLQMLAISDSTCYPAPVSAVVARMRKPRAGRGWQMSVLGIDWTYGSTLECGIAPTIRGSLDGLIAIVVFMSILRFAPR